MAEGLSRKKRIRAGHRASATRTMKQIDALLAAPSAEASAEVCTAKVESRREAGNVEAAGCRNVGLTSEDDLENEIQQADEFKDEIYSAIVRLRPVSVPVPVSATSMPRTPPPSDDRIKLPKLTIPPFEGTSHSGHLSGIHMSLPFIRILASQKSTSSII